MAEGDLIMLHDEDIDTTQPLTIFDPTYTWKETTFKNYTIKELQKPLFINGECKYVPKSVVEIKKHVNEQLNKLPLFGDSNNGCILMNYV